MGNPHFRIAFFTTETRSHGENQKRELTTKDTKDHKGEKKLQETFALRVLCR